MESVLAGSIVRQRFNMLLLGTFAGMALTLSALGLYGVISYAVARRTHEVGIRMALGAAHADVLRLIVGQGMKVVAIGPSLCPRRDQSRTPSFPVRQSDTEHQHALRPVPCEYRTRES